MPDYSKGKIYTIRCHSNDSLIYVGATIQSLAVRFGGHKTPRSGSSISKYIANEEHNTSWDDWHIELHEMFPCDNKMELDKREKEVIREIATINQRGYYIDEKDYREKNKQRIAEINKNYRGNNTDAIKERKKIYYVNNKNIINENNKVYYNNNRETFKNNNKVYVEAHKDEIKEYKKVYAEVHKDEIKEYMKVYQEAHKKAIAEKKKQYYEKNKNAIKEKNKAYRERKNVIKPIG